MINFGSNKIDKNLLSLIKIMSYVTQNLIQYDKIVSNWTKISLSYQILYYEEIWNIRSSFKFQASNRRH